MWAARTAVTLDAGDLVECGVFRGDIAWVVATLLGDAMRGRTFYLYDSFAGFSTQHSSPDDFPHNPGFFDFANEVDRQPGLFDLVKGRFEGKANVRIVRGFLPEALTLAMPERICFLHIDLNSPAAELGVLKVLFDRVVRGGMIVFDDYGWRMFHRQRDAENEFMAARNHTILELPTGQGLVVKH